MKIDGNFCDLPIDPDTDILSNEYLTFDGIEILIQVWFWSGISGMSAIFPNKTIKSMDEATLVALLREIIKVEENYTFKVTENFTFVNFNFSLDKIAASIFDS